MNNGKTLQHIWVQDPSPVAVVTGYNLAQRWGVIIDVHDIKKVASLIKFVRHWMQVLALK
jgi:hypothetical protein